MADQVVGNVNNNITLAEALAQAGLSPGLPTSGDLLRAITPIKESINGIAGDVTQVQADVEALSTKVGNYSQGIDTAGRTAAIAEEKADALQSSKKADAPSTDKSITFIGEKNVDPFTISSDLTLTADYTNAVNGCGTTFTIMQNNNAKVIFPAEIVQTGGVADDINGCVNTYFVIRLGGTYQWTRTVPTAFLPEVAVSSFLTEAQANKLLSLITLHPELFTAIELVYSRYIGIDFTDLAIGNDARNSELN
jgi:outer membrane murein-binding lipoprotein Lpp